MDIGQAAVLCLTALLAGAQNSVAGGGSFLTVPVLIFSGVLPIQANATSTVALWPGSVASIYPYRDALDTERWALYFLGGISVVGGILGAIILLRTPQGAFLRILPWMLLGATLLFTFGGPLTARLRARKTERPPAPRWLSLGLLGVFQFAVALYGGFFGGGIGILMLAMLVLTGMTNIHTMNALKVILASCINAVAVVTFVIAGKVYWPEAIVMTAGAIVGGFFGALVARRIPQRYVRWYVTIVGLVMTVILFLR